jgi:hypothetical protein
MSVVQWGLLLPSSCWFLAWLILRIWRWRRNVPPKHWLTFIRLHGDVFQKMEENLKATLLAIVEVVTSRASCCWHCWHLTYIWYTEHFGCFLQVITCYADILYTIFSFPYFGKIKVGLWATIDVSTPRNKFWTPVPIWMKLGMVGVSTAYLWIPPLSNTYAVAPQIV